MKLSRIWLAPAILLPVIGLGACNTIEGMGEDVSAVGNTVSDTSREVRKDDSQATQQTARRPTERPAD